MSNTLKKITARAKQLRKASPKMEWKTAVKKAGAEYRAGAKKKVTKKAAPKKRAVKKVGARPATVKRAAGSVAVSAGATFAALRKKLLQDIGTLEAQKFGAKLKRDKNVIAKKITEKKKQYRKLV